MTDIEDRTHVAYGMKREGRRLLRPIEIGTGRLDGDGTFHAYLDRLPIGGFNGYVCFAPLGAQPPQVEPERPGQSFEDD